MKWNVHAERDFPSLSAFEYVEQTHKFSATFLSLVQSLNFVELTSKVLSLRIGLKIINTKQICRSGNSSRNSRRMLLKLWSTFLARLKYITWVSNPREFRDDKTLKYFPIIFLVNAAWRLRSWNWQFLKSSILIEIEVIIFNTSRSELKIFDLRYFARSFQDFCNFLKMRWGSQFKRSLEFDNEQSWILKFWTHIWHLKVDSSQICLINSNHWKPPEIMSDIYHKFVIVMECEKTVHNKQQRAIGKSTKTVCASCLLGQFWKVHVIVSIISELGRSGLFPITPNNVQNELDILTKNNRGSCHFLV